MMMPTSLIELLNLQLERAKILHQQDLSSGCGNVYLPYALKGKYPHTDREWNWQYVFPAANRSIDHAQKFIVVTMFTQIQFSGLSK